MGDASDSQPRHEQTTGMPRTIRRRQLLALARPTVAAATVLALAPVVGLSLVPGLLLAALVGFSARLPERIDFPLELVPTSHVLLTVTGPLVGAGAAALLMASAGGSVEPAALSVVAIAAAATTAVVELIGTSWLRRHPVRIAVMGSMEFARGLRRELQESGIREFELVGWLNIGTSPANEEQGTYRLRRALIDHQVDLLVHGRGSDEFGNGSRKAYERAAESCADLPVRLIDGAQLYEKLFGHVPMGVMNSAWYLYIAHPDFEPPSGPLTRVMDLLASSLIAVLSAPVLLVAAIAIKLEDGGPILYRQPRIGAGGEEFEILKLRTMGQGAQHDSEQWSYGQDQRVTKVGRVLRRLHLDEIPQVYNVLRNEMTMVGPRPEQPRLVRELERSFSHYSRRHLVKPGVTGWAQVRCGYAGSLTGSAWKVCHDLYYLKHRGLVVDLMIMLETARALARDSHRAGRAPASQFLAGAQLGLLDSDPGEPAEEMGEPAGVATTPAPSS